VRLLLVLCLSCSSGDGARHGLGGSCAGDADCATSLVCVTDDPGGQCTRFCSADSQCGAGSLCNDEGKCYQACAADGDCPRHASDPGYGCVGTAPRLFCDVLEESSDAGAD
jgi:hypothetical protein